MGSLPGTGVAADHVAHLLSSAVLVLSFGLLYQRRLTAMIGTYAMQAWALAAAAFWQGWVQGSPALYIAGAITAGAIGMAAPITLRRIVRRQRIHGGVETTLGLFPCMVAGLALVALAVLLVRPATMDSPVLTREDLALALSVVLVGLLVMITRRTTLPQVVGFMSIGNGLVLGLVSVRGMPLVAASSVAVLVLLGAAVSGLFFFGIREHLEGTRR